MTPPHAHHPSPAGPFRGLRWLPMLLLVWALRAQGPGALALQTYGSEQGMGPLVVEAMEQDDAGYLWVGGRGGLYRLEDARFRNFGAAFGLESEQITALARDSGGLWAGTEAGLWRFDGRRFERKAGGLPELPVLALARDVGGRVWVHQEGGIFWGGTGGFRQAPLEQPRLLWVDPGKPRVLVLCGDGMLYQREGEEEAWTRLGRGPEFGGERPLAMLQDPAGQIWLRSRTRLYRGDPGRPFENLGPRLPLSQLGEGRLYLDRLGRVWVPTLQGLALWERGNFSRPRFDLPRGSGIIRRVLMDREGVLWFAGEEVHRLLGQGAWNMHRTAEGLPANVVWDILRDGRGVLWVATGQGLARSAASGWERVPGTEGSSFTTLALGREGQMWAAGPRGLLARVGAGGSPELFKVPELGNPESTPTALRFDEEGRLWAGTSNAGLFRIRLDLPGLPGERVGLPDGQPRERIHSLALDRKGRLWVAGERGLALLEEGTWRRFGHAQGFESFVALATDPAGDLWASLAAEGALLHLVYEGGALRTTERLDQAKGLPRLPLHALSVDARGVLWAGGAQAILRYGEGILDLFGKGEGLPSSGCNPGALFNDPDGDLWAGTAGGVAHFRSAFYRGVPPAPRTEMVEARFGPRWLWAPGLGVHRFGLEEASAEFTFATLSHVDPAGLHRQARLVGLEEDWHDLDGSVARYPKLPPGLYQFEVRSRLTTTAWGPPAILRFRIAAPWYQSGWIYGLGGLGILASLWSLYLRIVGALRRRNLALESTVAERTADLQEALDRAEEASRAKDDFLATMSHEIRTPMHAILGMTNLLLDSRLTRDQKESAQTIKHAATALMSIIGDILDYAQIEASKISLRNAPFDLRDLAEELVDLMAVTAHQKGLELVLRYPDPGPALVMGDPDRLRQILVNLLGNAIKFTGEGFVMLDVEVLEHLHQRMKVRISVVDSGVGIAQEKQRNLFRKFTQADTSIARRFGGTGLGLAITQQLVERMGGTVGLQSQPGKGSTFWLELELPAAEGTRELGSHPWSGLRVMIVDDLEPFRRSVADRLSRWGLAIGSAASLEEAMQQLERAASFKDPFNLLLLDEGLGGELPRTIVELRAAAGEHPLVCVLLCPMHMPVDTAFFQDAGLQGLLRKPIHDWELRETLAGAYGQLTGRRPSSWLGDEEAPSDLEATFAEAPRPAWGSHPPRLLLVEDNPLNQQVAIRILAGLGLQATLASSGAEAVELAAAGGHDLILMDVHMPGMDGVQATQAIRRKERGRRIPIIAMTAHALERDHERFIEAGMDALLTKPFGREELRAAMERVLGGLPGLEEAGDTVVSSKAKVLDRKALLASVSEGGRLDREGLKELLELFERHAPRHLSRLAEALAQEDLLGVREAAHSLCGSSAYVFAQVLVEACKAAEEAAAREDLASLREGIPALEGHLTAAWAQLEALRAEFGLAGAGA
ncbi:MAG: response regulator [Acidobacteria bacterium]|nr:response regulator [Acidobacteriota bacterium]